MENIVWLKLPNETDSQMSHFFCFTQWHIIDICSLTTFCVSMLLLYQLNIELQLNIFSNIFFTYTTLVLKYIMSSMVQKKCLNHLFMSFVRHTVQAVQGDIYVSFSFFGSLDRYKMMLFLFLLCS